MSKILADISRAYATLGTVAKTSEGYVLSVEDNEPRLLGTNGAKILADRKADLAARARDLR